MAAEMSENVFRILEIEPTTDKKEIKRAYARLVKRYHPEEFPEEWEKIHGAYEQALKIAEYGKPPMSTEPPEPSMQMEALKLPAREEAPETEPPEMIDEEKVPEKSGEMDSLFDNIGELSKEQQQQNEEAFQRELHEVMDAFRKISDKKIDIKEWEDFFYQDTRLPYICTREFLEMLGDCFLNRKIDAEMYHFLKGQLAIAARYISDRDIVLKEIGILKPVDYAEKNIYKAYAGESADAGRSGSGTTSRKTRKAVWVILIIVGIIVRSSIRHARNTREMSELQTIPRTVIENTIANSTIENADDDIVQNIIPNNLVERNGNTVRTRIPLVPDKIQTGDSREVMIEALGEPEEIRGSQENPDKEEAVYSSFGFGDSLIVVLENDVITDIYVEYTMEDAASDTYPVKD